MRDAKQVCDSEPTCKMFEAGAIESENVQSVVTGFWSCPDGSVPTKWGHALYIKEGKLRSTNVLNLVDGILILLYIITRTPNSPPDNVLHFEFQALDALIVPWACVETDLQHAAKQLTAANAQEIVQEKVRYLVY